jgi:hypothetical protein
MDSSSKDTHTQAICAENQTQKSTNLSTDALPIPVIVSEQIIETLDCQFERLKKLLKEINEFRLNNLITQEESHNFSAAIEAFNEKQLEEFAVRYFENKSCKSNDADLVLIFRELMSIEIKNHLNGTKITFLNDLESLHLKGLIGSDECSSIKENLESLSDDQLFAKLCFYESAYEILNSAEEIAEEIKAIFFNESLNEIPNEFYSLKLYSNLRNPSLDIGQQSQFSGNQSQVIKARLSSENFSENPIEAQLQISMPKEEISICESNTLNSASTENSSATPNTSDPTVPVVSPSTRASRKTNIKVKELMKRFAS